jgi:glutamate-1-semialdehyde 2,1-aminomutase
MNKKCSERVLNESYTTNSIYIKSAAGAYLEDSTGKTYIDLCLGAGTHILGHNSSVVKEGLLDQISKGTLYMGPNQKTCEFTETLYNATGRERFVFCNSGAEATMRAMRIARAYTGKNKIALFSGGWHGGQDNALFDDDYLDLNSPGKVCYKSAGLNKDLKKSTLMLPYNSDEAIDIIKNAALEIALVIIEPSQGSNPRDDIGEFLRKLREVTLECEVLLCFDEIITGFRVSMGGASEHYGITPDLITFGKTVGGGLPIGVVSGDKLILDSVSNNKLPVFYGGTFSANPLSMAAGNSVISYLLANNDVVYTELDFQSSRIKTEVNQFCIKNNISARVVGIKSMLRIIFTDKMIKSRKDRERYEISQYQQVIFYKQLLIQGVYIGNNGIIFISIVHNEEIINAVIRAICDVFEKQSNEWSLQYLKK